MNTQAIKIPKGGSSLQRTGHRLVKTGWKLFGDIQYCVSRRDLGDALAEDTAQDLWNMAEHLMAKMGELVGPPAPLVRAPPEPKVRAAIEPKATPRGERRAVVREEPAAPPAPQQPVVLQAPEPILAPPPPVLEPPPPAPAEAARAAPSEETLSIEEAARRRIDHLCADYEPRPPAVRPLASPLPRDWREDPAYVVNDPLLLGASGPVPQRGTIGRDFRDGFRVSLNLSEPFCLSAFSLPGAGKSYLQSLILQMGVQPLRYLNELSRPACAIVFHSDKDAGYLPEALSCVDANFHPEEVRHLMENYGALPEGMRDVVLLCPLPRVEEMRARYPHCRVHPILFSLSEVGMAGLRVLLGLRDGAQSLYVRVLGQLLQRLGDGVTLDGLWEAVEAEPLLNAQQRKLIQARLNLVRPLIDDRWPLRRVLRPGRIVVVDVRDPWMAQADVSLLFALLSSVLVQRPEEGQDFLKLVCFGEAHKHFGSPELAGEIERIARQRRHLLVGLLIESQDPLSIPRSILSLSDMLAIGKMSDEAWVKHLCKANENLRGLQVKHTTPLRPGYLWLWAERSYASGDLDQKEHEGLHLVRIRPQVAQHGGHTRKLE